MFKCKMKHGCLLMFLLFAKSVYSQEINRTYQVIKQPVDSMRSKNYRVEVIKLTGDSTWLMRQYDSHDTLMCIGIYKDKELKIPNGRFRYYTYVEASIKVKYNSTYSRFDTIVILPAKNYLRGIGFYNNGLKTGIWSVFNRSGSLERTQTFDNDKLNGLFRDYYSNQEAVKFEGNYINDKREGEWKSYSPDGDIRTTLIYKNDLITETKNYQKPEVIISKPAYPDYDFVKYLNRELASRTFNNTPVKKVHYSFDIDEQGNFSDAMIYNEKGDYIDLQHYSIDELAIDNAIIDIILHAPKWHPRSYGKGVHSEFNLMWFTITVSKDHHIILSEFKTISS